MIGKTKERERAKPAPFKNRILSFEKMIPND
jgi:hypothetical protein